MASPRLALTAPAIATIATCGLLATACGSSSSQTSTVTGPSPAKCAIQIRADNASFPSAGGTGTLGISTSRECAWTVKSEATWVTVAAAEGQGEGSVKFTVSANANPSSRSTGIGVNDQRVQITQAAIECEFSLSSKRETVEGAGGDRTIQVRANSAACSWTATPAVPWITILSGREGRGDGDVRFHVDAVSGPPRTGTLTVAGQTVNVEQGTGCSYGIGADTFAVEPGGGQRQVGVTAPAGCDWTAESQTAWITITNGATGSGPGNVGFRIAATDGPARTGTFTAAGRRVTVTQGTGCTLSVTPQTINADARGGPASISVQTGAGCSWSASSGNDWLTIAGSASGSGAGQVQVAVGTNVGPARTGSVTIAGRAVSIAQASGCSYSVAPAIEDVPGAGGTRSVAIGTAAGCSWSASSGVEWITMSPLSGAGPAQVSLSVAPNASPVRAGTVTIAGQTRTVNQASQCTWVLLPPFHEFEAAGGNGNVLVIVTGDCTWTAASNADWIRMTAGTSGRGNGLVQFVVVPNPGAARSGIVTIAGLRYVVNEKAATSDR